MITKQVELEDNITLFKAVERDRKERGLTVVQYCVAIDISTSAYRLLDYKPPSQKVAVIIMKELDISFVQFAQLLVYSFPRMYEGIKVV